MTTPTPSASGNRPACTSSRPAVGEQLTGTVRDVTFTRGSPFGEQWWSIEAEGQQHRVAMHLDCRDATRWPQMGEEVTVRREKDLECHVGGGSKLILSPYARLVGIKRA